MKIFYLLLLAATTCIVTAGEFQKAVSSALTPYTRGAEAFVEQRDDGGLIMDTGSSRGSAQASVFVDAKKIEGICQESPFNYHVHKIELSFDLEDMEGEPQEEGGRNVFFVSIGEDSEGNHVPQNRVLDNGIGLLLEKVKLPNPGGAASTEWRLRFGTYKGSLANESVLAILTGRPTGLTYVISDGAIQIQLEGAEVAAKGRGSLFAFPGGTEIEVAIGELEPLSSYALCLGAYNLGPVDQGTVVRLKQVEISVR